MNKDELANKLAEIARRAETTRKAVMLEYAKANNPYKIGDVFTDHMGSIEITEVLYSLVEKYPCAVYGGIILNSNGDKNKSGKTRRAHQSNAINEKIA